MHEKEKVSYPHLSVCWYLSGMLPTEVMTSLKDLPEVYYNYILHCFKQENTSLPKPEMEFRFLSSKIETEQDVNLLKVWRDCYLVLMLACAQHDLDEITDYQPLLENEGNQSGEDLIHCMQRLIELLHHFDRIERGSHDPRVVCIFNTLLAVVKKYYIDYEFLDSKTLLKCIEFINKRGRTAECRLLVSEAMSALLKKLDAGCVLDIFDHDRVKLYSENLEFIESLYRLYGNKVIPTIVCRMQIDANSGYQRKEYSCLLLSQLVSQLPVRTQSEVQKLLGEKLCDWIWPENDSFTNDKDYFQIYQMLKLIKKVNDGAITFNSFIENAPLISFDRKPFANSELYKLYCFELKSIMEEFIITPECLLQIIDYYSAVKKTARNLTDFEFLFNRVLIANLYSQYNHVCVKSLPFYYKEQLIDLYDKSFNHMTDIMLSVFLSGLSEEEYHGLITLMDTKGLLLVRNKQFLLDNRNLYTATVFMGGYEAYSFLTSKLMKTVLALNFNANSYEQLDAPLRGDPHLLRHLPIGLATAVINSHEVPESIGAFVERFNKANQHAGERHAIHYENFMLGHVHQLVNLYEVLGNDLFLFLTKCMSTSVLWLTRFLENILHIPTAMIPLIKEAYDIFGKKYKNEFCDILLLISQYNYVTNQLYSSTAPIHDNTVAAMNRWRSLLKQPGINLQKLHDSITKDLVAVYCDALQIAPDTNLNLSILLQNRELMPNLMTGRMKVRQSNFSHVLDRLIVEHIKEGGSFIDFTTNMEQTDPLGKALAEHNNAIRTVLSQNNIDVELAFNYQKQKTFEVRSKSKIDLPTLYNAIWNDIENVTTQLNKLYPSISKVIDDIKIQVLKGCNDLKPRLDRLANENCIANLNAFAKLYEELRSDNNVPDGLREHGGHLNDRIALLMSTKKKDKSEADHLEKLLDVSKRYVVKRWDKNNIRTFLLGNDVHCCLATNGTRFEASIQRAMDDAMFMDVVIDVELNEVVSLNWLYYGEDENNPGDIYVVANFYEIRPSIGMKAEVRDHIVHELTEFTGEFAREIRVKGYLISPLRYGIIPDFKDQFETKSIKIKKVGGYFNPVDLCTYDANDEENKSRYYLTSVDLDKFYLHATPKPAVQFANANGLLLGHSVFFIEESNKKTEAECAQVSSFDKTQGLL